MHVILPTRVVANLEEKEISDSMGYRDAIETYSSSRLENACKNVTTRVSSREQSTADFARDSLLGLSSSNKPAREGPPRRLGSNCRVLSRQSPWASCSRRARARPGPDIPPVPQTQQLASVQAVVQVPPHLRTKHLSCHPVRQSFIRGTIFHSKVLMTYWGIAHPSGRLEVSSRGAG